MKIFLLFRSKVTKSITLLFFLLAFLPLSAQQVNIHHLSNGMTVWLNPDSTASKFMGYVVVKAGARDCPNTGIAHYFEHIMFKGTQQIGTTNYKSTNSISRQPNMPFPTSSLNCLHAMAQLLSTPIPPLMRPYIIASVPHNI